MMTNTGLTSVSTTTVTKHLASGGTMRRFSDDDIWTAIAMATLLVAVVVMIVVR